MKPGYKTTEFWLTAIMNVAAAVIAILAARGLLSGEEGELWLTLVQAIAVMVLPIVMAQTTTAYTQARAKVKTESPIFVDATTEILMVDDQGAQQ